MKILYLIPPSEGKQAGGILGKEALSFSLKKPFEILKHLSEKDLKCTGKRFEEAEFLNQKHFSLLEGEVMPAYKRYNGVMYKAIDYEGLNPEGKKYFCEHFMICSGMYGLLRPTDMIQNYKLPIEAKGLAVYWRDTFSQSLNDLKADIIVDLLPLSYKKMIDFSKISSPILHYDFYSEEGKNIKKMTHGVKKIKGEYIKNICLSGGSADIFSEDRAGKTRGNINIIYDTQGQKVRSEFLAL